MPGKIQETFNDLINKALNFGRDFVNNIVNGISQIGSKISDTLGGFFSGFGEGLGNDRGGLVPQRFARGGRPKPIYASNGYGGKKGADVIPAFLRKNEMVLTPNIGTQFTNFLKSISRMPNVTSSSQGGVRERIEKINSGFTMNVKNFNGTTTSQARKTGGSFAYGLKRSLLASGY